MQGEHYSEKQPGAHAYSGRLAEIERAAKSFLFYNLNTKLSCSVVLLGCFVMICWV